METRKASKPLLYCGLFLKVAIIAVGFLGIVANLKNAGSFMNGTYLFLYFTIISALAAMLSAFLFMVIDIVAIATGRECKLFPLRLYRFASAIAVLLTMGVFFALLLPTSGPGYAESFANVSVHLAVPLLALIDALFFDRVLILKKGYPLFGCLLPLLYLLFVYCVCYPLGIKFGAGTSKFPYYFMDFDKLGWFEIENGNIGTAYYILILLAALVAASYLFAAIKNLIAPKKEKPPVC